MTPTGKISYFKHFPFHFVRPYDAQQRCTTQEFLQKLNVSNCEWFLRPKVAISEACEALRKNWEIVYSGSVVHDELKHTFEQLIDPIIPSLAALDSKDKTTPATNQHVFELMNSCFHAPDLDSQLADVMHEAAALYVFAAQLRAMRALVKNPEHYANKLTSDAPEAVQFRNTKTVASMQRMFTTLCVPNETAQTPNTMEVRALASQLVNPANPNAQITGLPCVATLTPNNGLTNPTTTATTTTPGLGNQAIDMILQLQAQIQGMQQELLQKQAPPPSTADISPPPDRPKKKKRSRIVLEDIDEEQPSTSKDYTSTEPQDPETQEQDHHSQPAKRKKARKGNK